MLNLILFFFIKDKILKIHEQRTTLNRVYLISSMLFQRLTSIVLNKTKNILKKNN